MKTLFKILISLIFICFIATIVFITKYETTTNYITAKVIEKQTIEESSDIKSYLIFCKDRKEEYYTFINKDSVTHNKYNSTLIQNKIKIGHTYYFQTRGFTIKELSIYPNVFSIVEVSYESNFP